MEALIFMIIGGLIVAFVIASHRRGVRFVRAYFYLLSLDQGASVEDANRSAAFVFSRYNPTSPRFIMQGAKRYAAEYHNGQQASVIHEAQMKGFIG